MAQCEAQALAGIDRPCRFRSGIESVARYSAHHPRAYNGRERRHQRVQPRPKPSPPWQRPSNLRQGRRGLAKVVRTVAEDKNFRRRSINGLPVWERLASSADGTAKPDFAVARVGPATLAVGAPAQVDELVLVRIDI